MQKKLVTKNIEEEFVNIVLEYAIKNKMTIANIRDGLYKATEFMEENAVVEIESELKKTIWVDDTPLGYASCTDEE